MPSTTVRPNADLTKARAVVVSALYPPDIGGSAVLFGEIYTRVAERVPVTVLTQERDALNERRESKGGRSTLTFGPSDLRPARRSGVREGGTFGPLIVRRPLSGPRWGVTGLPQHVAVAGAIRRLAPRRSAVVHCGRALPEGVAAYVNRALGGAPYVCWSHGEDVATSLTSRDLTFVMRRVYMRASGVLANSANTARMIRDLGVPESRVHVVYPGVDTQRFHPGVDGHPIRRLLPPDAQFVLLSVGRLQRRKGHDTVIEAMAHLRDVPGLHYLVVGTGEERARLDAMVASHGLADRVTFAGAVAPDLLPACYAASDLFVMPNRIDGSDVEGFGIVFLEAASAGKPAIGGNSGGVPEAVKDGVTGRLVSGTDPAELAAAIRTFAGDAGLRAQTGTAGRDRAVRWFDWTRAAEAVAAVHDSVAREAASC